MSTQIDFKVLELLTSKICHDLISPIGAVNNGMEFVEEMGAEAGEEVFDLIGFSAQQASAKLQAFRMAFGAGGADYSIKPEVVYDAIESIVGAEEKIKQDWDPHAPLGPEERPDGFAKLLTIAFLLTIDCLPKGGTISATAGDNDTVIVSGTGVDAAPREDMDACLKLSIANDQLKPKNVHVYVSAMIAKQYGFDLQIKDAGDGHMSFVITPPSA